MNRALYRCVRFKNVVAKLKKASMVLLLIICLFISFGQQHYEFASASALTATVDFSEQSGTNNLELGTQITFHETSSFPSSTIRKGLIANASFQVIRVFDKDIGYPNQPCRTWNDTSKTGMFNWTAADNLINSILAVGAQPLLVLGFASSFGLSHTPIGMEHNSTTGLPNPDEYAAYVGYWANHFISKVKYWEIINEPYAYFGWTPGFRKLGYLMSVYNASYTAMKAINSTFSIAIDHDAQQNVLDYIINHNILIDRIDYHDYNANGEINQSSPDYCGDSKIFSLASRNYFADGYPYTYSVSNAARYYQAHTGRSIPIWDTESNLNSHWDGGTDPRMVYMNGTIWDALVSMSEILNGVSVRIHYETTSSWSYETSTTYGGYGFGLIDTDTNKPTLAYWFYYMIGSNLEPGDRLYLSSSASSSLETLAWANGSTNNLLLIHKSTASDVVSVRGFVDDTVYYERLDGSISYGNSYLLTGSTNVSSISLNGYTILLLQQTASQPPNGTLADLVSFAKAYNSKSGSTNWNPIYDLNGDRAVNLLDLVIFATRYSQQSTS